MRTLTLCTLFLLGAGIASGCSLTSIVDVIPGECSGATPEGDRACQEALDPDNPGCSRFKCVDTGEHFQCQKVGGESGGEVCDGLDNDCDGLVDEPNGNDPVISATSTGVVSSGQPLTRVSVSEGAFGRRAYLQTESGLETVDLTGESSDRDAIGLVAQPAGASTNQQRSALAPGCYRADGSNQLGSCIIDQAVVSSTQESGFFAALNTSGCSAGELRVGVIDSNLPDEFIDRGLGSRDPTYRGVMTRGSACSDNLTDACEAAKNARREGSGSQQELLEACGVSAPAIDALFSDDVEQAFVAYLGRSATEDACDAPVNVLGLGLQEAVGNFNGEFSWSNPSGDGEAEILGTTTGYYPPAVLGVDGHGYFVAHPSDGKVELLWVPALSRKGQKATFDCPDGDCDSRDGFETPALPTPKTLASLTTGASAVDGLHLSSLETSGTRIAVSVTWLTGCGNALAKARPAAGQVLHFDLGDIDDADAGASPELLETFATVNLGTSTTPPLTLPTDNSFVSEGFSREGKMAGTTGGFWAVTSPSSVVVRRIAAFDGQLVASGEEIPAPDSVRFALSAAGQDEFLAEERTAGDLAQVTLTCR